MATAEQWIGGESLNARLFGVSLHRGDVDLARLTELQAAGAAGLLSRCMADFIVGVAGNREQVIKPVSYTHLDVYKRQLLLTP